MLSKKHFISFAKAIKNLIDESVYKDNRRFVEANACADIVCKVAGEDNPNFDEARFRKACGLTELN